MYLVINTYFLVYRETYSMVQYREALAIKTTFLICFCFQVWSLCEVQWQAWTLRECFFFASLYVFTKALSYYFVLFQFWYFGNVRYRTNPFSGKAFPFLAYCNLFLPFLIFASHSGLPQPKVQSGEFESSVLAIIASIHTVSM